VLLSPAIANAQNVSNKPKRQRHRKKQYDRNEKIFLLQYEKRKKPPLNRAHLLAPTHEPTLRKQKSPIFCQR